MNGMDEDFGCVTFLVRHAWHSMRGVVGAALVDQGLSVAQYGTIYATITIVKRGPETGYRVDDVDGSLVGYYRTLKASSMAGHMRFLSHHGGRGAPNGGGSTSGHGDL